METVARAAIMFSFIWLVLRVIGRKELSGMTSFELVLLVVMGDLIQQGVTQQDTSVTAAMLAVGTMALLVMALSYASFRWRRVQRIAEGMPVVIVRDGELLREYVRMERLTEEDIKEAAREQGIGDLANVAVGILEADGRFSFITTTGPTRQQQVRGTEPKAT
jgi:uncharacterized membrane protein YcaP (DUF421 family)